MPASVLIIDHPPDAEILRAIVEAEGHTVEVTSSTALGVDILRRQSVQLVLSEVRARDIDGWDLLAAVERHSPDTHVVFLLGSVSDEIEEVLRRLDVDSYLLKPFDKSRLRTLLRALLDPSALDRTTEACLFLPADDTRTFTEQALADAGIYVEAFDDHRALLATVDNDPPHLVIVDIGPASEHGFTVCKAVRASSRYIPILAISNLVTRADVARAASLQVNDLILEPLQAEDLKRSALRLLRQTRPSRRSK